MIRFIDILNHCHYAPALLSCPHKYHLQASHGGMADGIPSHPPSNHTQSLGLILSFTIKGGGETLSRGKNLSN